MQFAAAVTLNANRNIQLNAGGGTLDTQGNTVTYNGVFSGPGSLTKLGSGMLQLNNANVCRQYLLRRHRRSTA